MSSSETELGPLASTVMAFLRTMEDLVSNLPDPVPAEYWAPLEAFVAVDDFERRVPEDAFAESSDGGGDWGNTVMDWRKYRELFGMWAASGPTYSNAVQRVAEFPGLVYLEIEEHHTNGGDTHLFNSLGIYEFNDEGKIDGVRVAPAADRLTVLPGC